MSIRWICSKFGGAKLKNQAFIQESKDPMFYDKLNHVCE